jgi:hypothetical protein
VFVSNSYGHLLADAWDGVRWTWFDLGQPAPGVQVYWPAAITYRDTAGIQHIRVFATGGGVLYAAAWDGVTWKWSSLGVPGGVALSKPSAITYQDAAGIQHIRVFAAAGQQGGDLYVAAWDSAGWNGWTWFGLGGAQVSDPTAIVYGTSQIRVFARGSSGQLLVDAWDGAGWTWFDLGHPPLLPLDAGRLAAITYRDWAGVSQIRVFATATSELYAAAWDGVSWTWSDLGDPIFPASKPSAITYPDAAGVQHPSVFDIATNLLHTSSFLTAYAWNGASWQEYGFKLPNYVYPGPYISDSTAITYQDVAGIQHIRVFVTLSNGDLLANSWDGASWTWFDLGPGL